MKRLLKNKLVIQILITFIILITMVIISIALVENAEKGDNNIKCFWTTNGIICGGELGGN